MGRFAETWVRVVADCRRQETFRLYDRLKSNLYLKEDALNELSLGLLRETLRHAHETTAAYRKRLDEAQVEAGRIQSLADLARIRVLDRAELKQDLAAFTSTAVDPKHVHRKSTSGSSGDPLVFPRDNRYLDVGRAGTIRNMALAGWEPGDAVAHVWGFDHSIGSTSDNLRSCLSRSFFLNAFEQNERSMLEWVKTLRRYRVRYLYGYPPSLAAFAQFVAREGIDLPMRAVFSTAQRYMSFEREAIEAAFQCKSYDLYGSSEIQNIAFECPRGSMHIATDYVVVQEQPSAEPTMPPSLILTSLWSRSVPFIRYDLGDYGRLVPGACACGLKMPLLEIFGGRRFDFLAGPNGPVHGALIGRAFNGIPGLARYQVVQHDLSKFTVRAEISPGADPGRVRAAVTQSAQRVLGQHFFQVDLKVEFPEWIPPSKSGKHRFIIREAGGHDSLRQPA